MLPDDLENYRCLQGATLAYAELCMQRHAAHNAATHKLRTWPWPPASKVEEQQHHSLGASVGQAAKHELEPLAAPAGRASKGCGHSPAVPRERAAHDRQASLEVIAICGHRCRKVAGDDALNVPVSGHTVDPAPGGAGDLAEYQSLSDGEADEFVAQLCEGFGVP